MLFGRERQVAAPGAKSAVSDCIFFCLCFCLMITFVLLGSCRENTELSVCFHSYLTMSFFRVAVWLSGNSSVV